MMTEAERAARGWPSTARVPFQRRALCVVPQAEQGQQERASADFPVVGDPCDEMGLCAALRGATGVVFGEGDA
ncbi:hypothetical protein [Amaricoccus solimangrovi]|uniref:Uncharacterized protein n=1 Tax=Amaricoccus solimangrovi TaxID=2589815 RepID=A0A501WXZ1_9RHOB|nr:hypothetical protein [Amaricoccus solimangrovi]TPE53064.1 hypothetical protein FJM51_03295 [Amaricoccus solimangrovi]